MVRRFKSLAYGSLLPGLLSASTIALGATPVAQMPTAAPTLSAFEAGLRSSYPELSAAGATSAMDPARVMAIADKNGFQRLDDAEVMTLLHLRAQLVMHAPQFECAEPWTGGYQEDLGTIESLPTNEQQQWAELLAEAAFATLKNRPVRPAPDANEVRLAMRRLLSALPPPEQIALLDMIDTRQNPGTAERCRGVRLFYGWLDKMDKSDALIVMRSLLYK